MIKNVKIQVTPEQTAKIQKVVFENNGSWQDKTKSCDWLIVTAGGDISWGTTDTLKCYSEISAEEWLQDALDKFPIYKMHKSERLIVRFDCIYEGEVVWVKSNSGISREVGEYSTDWVAEYSSDWKNVDINLYLSATQSNTQSEYKGGPAKIEKEIEQEYIQTGTIVLATRKNTSDKIKDYSWQGTYFGYCNGKHLIDANGTHVQLADEVSKIPTLTKKEAKQKISELFSQPKNVTSESIRNIIDLIKD